MQKNRKLLKSLKSKDEVFREVDVDQAELRDIHGENPALIELIVAPYIFSPIWNQTIELTQATHIHLITLPSADNIGGNTELDVHALIGGDYYWSFFMGKILHGKIGPVAMETLLDWVLSGNTGVRGSVK